MVRKTIGILASLMLWLSCAAQAGPIGEQHSLHTYQSWLTNCRNPEGVNLSSQQCGSEAGAGRRRRHSRQNYSIVPPPRATMPITQSGVAFAEGINRKIVSVPEDSERQTIIRLRNDMQCTVWASNPFESASPFDNPSVLESFLKVYLDTDVAQSIAYQQPLRGAAHPTLRFGTNEISGTYIRDAGAAIWVACRAGKRRLDERKMSEFVALIASSIRQY